MDRKHIFCLRFLRTYCRYHSIFCFIIWLCTYLRTLVTHIIMPDYCFPLHWHKLHFMLQSSYNYNQAVHAIHDCWFLYTDFIFWQKMMQLWRSQTILNVVLAWASRKGKAPDLTVLNSPWISPFFVTQIKGHNINVEARTHSVGFIWLKAWTKSFNLNAHFANKDLNKVVLLVP